MSRSTWCCLFTVTSLCTLSVFAYPQNGPVDKEWDLSDSGSPISNGKMLSVFVNRNRILDSPYFDPSYFDSERRKRGVPTVAVKLLHMGKAAAASLLKRTTEIPSDDEAIRKFVKAGDFDSALKDFHAVNPTYVWNWKRIDGVNLIDETSAEDYKKGAELQHFFAEMVEGRAGDRLIYVNSRGEQGMPTITIIDYKKAKVDWLPKANKDPYGHVTGKPIDRIIYKKSLVDD